MGVMLKDGPVTLRQWTLDDADALVERINDPAVAEFLDRVPQPYRLEDAHEYIGRSIENWRRDTDTSNFAILVDGIEGPVGSIGLHWNADPALAEIGYWVAALARGRGVATAATRLASRWAFEARPALVRLQLRADVENGASNRVAEKAGFTREGVARSSGYNARLERRIDFVIWSLLRAEL